MLLSGNLIQQKRQDFDQSRNINVNNVDISDECQPSYHEFGPVRDVERKNLFQYLNDIKFRFFI